MHKGDFATSIANRGIATKLETTYAWAYNQQGLTYAKKKDYDLAIQNYELAIRSNPYLKEPYLNLFTACVRTKDFQRAREVRDDALRRYPQWPKMIDYVKFLPKSAN
jgi:tetratricopeptide (TPR) repeat protein